MRGTGPSKGQPAAPRAIPTPNRIGGLERETHRKLAISRIVIDSENLAEVA